MSEKSSIKIRISSYNQIDSVVNYQSQCETPKCSSIPEGQINKNAEENLIAYMSHEKQALGDSSTFETIRHIAGEWGTHRFESDFWNEIQSIQSLMQHRRIKPSESDLEEEDNFENYDEDFDELSVDSDILNNDMIKSSLSYLNRCPIELKYILCKCILSNKELRDISAIKYYHYIQYLDISRNELTTLAPLGQLPYLQHLDASNNLLTRVLDFKAPFYLSHVNLSYNSFREIPDLTEFWSITDLDLSHNDIDRINGLESLRFLTYLNLSYNKIYALENLNNLRIQTLLLSHNNIDSDIVEEDPIHFSTLDFIRIVDLSHNNINSLEMFANAYNIEAIYIMNNDISNLLELYYLRNLRYLTRLNLKNNPIAAMKYYLKVCIENIKSLMFLDGREIPPEKRVSIENSPFFVAKLFHTDLTLLQQINSPIIEPYILPVNHPHPLIILLVGPPGSRKNYILKKFCRTSKMLVRGVSHTTRPKVEGEVDGEDYYFISRGEFRDLARGGHFIAVAEVNGYSFGILMEELYKAVDKVIIFHVDLNTALSLKMRGVNPKMVLALPRNENTHLNWLKEKYFYDETNCSIVRIRDPIEFKKRGEKFQRLDKEPITIGIKYLNSKDIQLQKMLSPGVDETTLTLHGDDRSRMDYYSEKDTTQSINTSHIEYQSLRESKKVSFSETAAGQTQKIISKGKPTGKMASLDLFISRIMTSREEVLEMHWSHPGLFHSIIFTDEIKSSISRLKNLMRNMDALYNQSPQTTTVEDGTYERLTKIRLTNLDLQGFTKLITEEIIPHCSCDIHYIEKNF